MQSALSSPRIAVVTGANKGIGLEIARKLGKTEGFMCVLAARNAAAGQEAAEILRADGANVEFQQLDIDDASSVRDFATRMHDAHGRIHVLVNNAAIAFKASDPTPFAQQAEPTMRTNFWNTVAVTDALLPLVRNTDGEGRVVFVASSAGRLGILKQRSHQELVTKEALTRDELYGFINRVSNALTRPRVNTETLYAHGIVCNGRDSWYPRTKWVAKLQLRNEVCVSIVCNSVILLA
jgi:carbonyl reductase 1